MVTSKSTREWVSKTCDRRLLYKRIPILSWLPRYSWDDAVSDLVAGITVGLTLMPQAIAYAALANLGPQYGLYSAFAGSFVYIVFGTCKEVNIGPTALMSLLTFNYTHDKNPDYAVLLCFLSGCVELLCGILQLGFLVEFVSVPVVSGFTSAAALIIASSQLKGILGISFKSENFIDTWWKIFNHIGETKLWDLVLGGTCVLVLLILRKFKDIKVGPKDSKDLTTGQKVINRVFWFLSTGRNAMVVVICAYIAFNYESKGSAPFRLTGRIESGLPPFGPPPFETTLQNQTMSFGEMCKGLGTGIIVAPLIAILGNVAIAKAFSCGAMLDATQEMITLGLCNVLGSFFRSMPVTGSFSRSAVNNASGVRTQMGGLYTGIMIILALTFLTPYFFYIPRATLSSVIICAVIFMVEYQTVLPMWKSNKRDLVPAVAAFLACLLVGVEYGILIGIAVDIAFLLYVNARPSVLVEKIMSPMGPEYIQVTPSNGLLFPAVDFVREAVAKAGANDDSDPIPVVVNCKHVQRADFTAAQGFQALVQDFKKRNQHVIFHNMKPAVAKILQGVCPPPEFIYATTEVGLIQLLKGLKSSVETADMKIDLDMPDVTSSSSETRC